MVWVAIILLFLIDVLFLIWCKSLTKGIKAVAAYAQACAKEANRMADMLENLIREKDVDDDR